ncbi:MAG: hypothetical protein KBD90_01060 [Alphaproteobacteria bacterium]|nr:hypothetical protein [Alphaproteobacteria bacterium]
MSSRDKLLSLQKQLEKLEERREKLIAQHALSLYRKAKKLLKDSFSPELVLVILNHARETAAAIQKQEEEARLDSFHTNCEKPEAIGTTDQQS